MANPALLIKNVQSTRSLSVDIKLDEDRAIRSNILAGASVDVGSVSTLDELLRNPQMRALLDSTPPKAAVITGAAAVQPRLVQAWAAGGPVDTPIGSPLPFAADIISIKLMISDAEAVTATVRDALAGGGDAYSDANSLAVLGALLDPGTGQTAGAGVIARVAAGTQLYLNRSGVASNAGTIIIELQRVD